MVTGERLYTAQDLWALAEDDKRLELLEGKIVEVSPAGDKHTLEGDDTLDGGDVLPGFALLVSRVFERMRTS